MPTRLAIIEDNPDNRLLFEVLLAGRYELTLFEGGREALEEFVQGPPDVVLLDVEMPEMNGYEVLRALRDTPCLAAVPVIAVTAHAMAGDRERLLSLGFADYVAKPIVDEAELIRLVDEVVERCGS